MHSRQVPYHLGVEMNVHGTYDTRAGDPAGSNALAIVFRIVVPIVIHLAAVAVTRLWPTSVVKHVNKSEDFNDVPSGFSVVDNPLSNGALPGQLKAKGSPLPAGPMQSFYVSTYMDPMAPPPWEQQQQQQRGGGQQAHPVNPPWIESASGSAADPNGVHLQHEVWRQMMLAQQAQLSQQSNNQQQQQQKQAAAVTQPRPAGHPAGATAPASAAMGMHPMPQSSAASPPSQPRQRMQPEVPFVPQGPLRYHDPTTSFGDYPAAAPLPTVTRGYNPPPQGPGPAIKPLVLGNGLIASPRLSTSPRISAYIDPDLDPSRSVSRIPAYLGPPEQQLQQPSTPRSARQQPEEEKETVVTAFGSPQVCMRTVCVLQNI